jgi:polyisoprenoid-binding protein YceI
LIRGVVFAAALTVTVSVPLPAFAADYTFDPVHTTAEFSVTHLAITKVTGKIPVVSGSLTTGANDMPTAASVTLSAKDLDTREADRDQELHGPDWLDVTKYPTITFVAKKIEGTPQVFTMMGDLTIHGVTQPVTLAGQFVGKVTDGRGHTHAGYSATTTIDRRQWGLNWGKTTPGGALIAAYDVAITINVDAIQK